jgi:hypothetical protein
MTVIDLSEKLDDLASRYERYWASDEALRELIALWGNPECNDCGVFERDETIRIELDGNKSWWAEICIATAPNGWHAFSTNYWSANGGGGSAPSVWDRYAYTSRDEAFAAAMDELIAKFEGIRDWTGWAPQNQAQLAQRMIDTLKAYLSQSRQLTLF